MWKKDIEVAGEEKEKQGGEKEKRRWGETISENGRVKLGKIGSIRNGKKGEERKRGVRGSKGEFYEAWIKLGENFTKSHKASQSIG